MSTYVASSEGEFHIAPAAYNIVFSNDSKQKISPKP